MLKTCLGCGTRYAWSLAACPHDGVTDYLESGQAILTLEPMSAASSGTLTVGHSAQVNASNGAATRTLPSAASAGVAGGVIVRKVDSTENQVTIQRAGSDLIDGATTYVLSVPGAGVELRSNGTNAWAATRIAAPDPLLTALFLTKAAGVGNAAGLAVTFTD